MINATKDFARKISTPIKHSAPKHQHINSPSQRSSPTPFPHHKHHTALPSPPQPHSHLPTVRSQQHHPPNITASPSTITKSNPPTTNHPPPAAAASKSRKKQKQSPKYALRDPNQTQSTTSPQVRKPHPPSSTPPSERAGLPPTTLAGWRALAG